VIILATAMAGIHVAPACPGILASEVALRGTERLSNHLGRRSEAIGYGVGRSLTSGALRLSAEDSTASRSAGPTLLG
jgi:hypothetical protein